MGQPKALLAAEPGVSFLGRLARTFSAAGLAPLAVLGANAEAIAAAHPAVPHVLNPHWPDGQYGSVLVGVRAALSQGATHLLVHPVDVPLIEVATVKAVKGALADAPSAIPTLNGRPGHPLGLRAEAARALLSAPAKTLEAAVAGLICAHVTVADPALLDNLNTPEAYQARFGRLPTPV